MSQDLANYWILVGMVLLPALVAYLAKKKGRSAVKYFFLSVIFTAPIMLFVLLSLKDSSRKSEAPLIKKTAANSGGQKASGMTQGDLTWKALNQESIAHAKNHDWGLFANTQLDMANFLFDEGRLKDALVHYLWVTFLDVNNPNNCGFYAHDQELLKEAPAFSVEGGVLPPAILKKISQLQAKLGLSDEELKSLFMTQISKRRINGMPISEIDAWNRISCEMLRIGNS